MFRLNHGMFRFNQQCSTKLARQLKHLDIVAAWLRHATGPMCAAVLAELEGEMAGRTAGKSGLAPVLVGAVAAAVSWTRKRRLS